MKFHCPSCNQKIEADEGWADHQVNWPACNQSLVVPGAVYAIPEPERPQGNKAQFRPSPAAGLRESGHSSDNPQKKTSVDSNASS